jgi:hypothetical protein
MSRRGLEQLMNDLFDDETIESLGMTSRCQMHAVLSV